MIGKNPCSYKKQKPLETSATKYKFAEL